SGAIALLLERSANLTPDQVKKIVVSTARGFGSGGLPAGAGAGVLDAYAATYSGSRGPANLGQRQADGVARTLYSALYGQPLLWKNATYLGTNWLGYLWQALAWYQTAMDYMGGDR